MVVDQKKRGRPAKRWVGLNMKFDTRLRRELEREARRRQKTMTGLLEEILAERYGVRL